METTNADGTKTEWGGAPGKVYDASNLNLVKPDGTFDFEFGNAIIAGQNLVAGDVLRVSPAAYKAV